MNDKSGREALTCDLSSKTCRQEETPLNKVLLRVASPFMRPFAWATSSHMGGRSEYPATPHSKRRWSIDSSATLPGSGLGEGENRAAPTPAATTPCSAATKAWTVALESPRVANTDAGGEAAG